MTYLARLKARNLEKGAGDEGTKPTKPSFVPFVAPGVARSRQIPERIGVEDCDALPDQAAESRRQRVLAKLADNPALRLAVVCDAEGDPVPVAVAIRDKGTCEVLVPASRFDPFALIELVERHSGRIH